MDILLKGIFFSVACLGFLILFNSPPRTLYTVPLMGFFAALIKYSLLSVGNSIVFSSFIAVIFIAFISSIIVKISAVPPLVASIPAIIPMLPGVFAYRGLLAIIHLGNENADRGELLGIIGYNFTVGFGILLALSVGVSIPILLTRKAVAQEVASIEK